MTENPYKVLGVSEYATEEEIKKAYTDLVKKFHPDRFKEDYMKELSEEKMKEINEAYDAINKGQVSNGYSSNGYQNQSQSSNNTDTDYRLREARGYVFNGNYTQARKILEGLTIREAEWFFLMGMLETKEGNYDSGRYYIQQAVKLAPNNPEYQQAYNQIFSGTFFSQRPSYEYRDNTANTCCQACAALWCLDTCCECGGGDLVHCC